ncbi:hypothetical protein BpHYR1_007291 [Brachionus plicatilis]|uniref:Uncharacterized protein n=1 Tax=Brachionus plicatilis TaxID=10195 RepID=A0A3M7R1F1_BRAPC|nr:hypothetical protein BpHYR1_007291 [Brachionus plicatilis]
MTYYEKNLYLVLTRTLNQGFAPDPFGLSPYSLYQGTYLDLDWLHLLEILRHPDKSISAQIKITANTDSICSFFPKLNTSGEIYLLIKLCLIQK